MTIFHNFFFCCKTTHTTYRVRYVIARPDLFVKILREAKQQKYWFCYIHELVKNWFACCTMFERSVKKHFYFTIACSDFGLLNKERNFEKALLVTKLRGRILKNFASKCWKYSIMGLIFFVLECFTNVVLSENATVWCDTFFIWISCNLIVCIRLHSYCWGHKGNSSQNAFKNDTKFGTNCSPEIQVCWIENYVWSIKI